MVTSNASNVGPGSTTPEEREGLSRRLEELGIDPHFAGRVLLQASPEALELLEKLAARATEPGSPRWKPMPLDEYRSVLQRLGEDYLGVLTQRGLSATADVTAEQLRDGVEVLAETARMIRSVPPASRQAMWPVMSCEVQAAIPHFQVIRRAIVETGVAAALDAQDHVVLVNLRREVIPELDLAVLRIAGESDPEQALAHLLRSARLAPRWLLGTTSVAQIIDEGQRHLSPLPPELTHVPNPKRWTGWGKLLTGMALAGANIAGGIALALGGGPLASGATAGGVIASCGVGVGGIWEGVGALRGE
jgi:hypothetical protein